MMINQPTANKFSKRQNFKTYVTPVNCVVSSVQQKTVQAFMDLTLQDEADYLCHEQYTVDTRDHEVEGSLHSIFEG
jgi:hypothetical protein